MNHMEEVLQLRHEAGCTQQEIPAPVCSPATSRRSGGRQSSGTPAASAAPTWSIHREPPLVSRRPMCNGTAWRERQHSFGTAAGRCSTFIGT